ncbi:S-adenosylmethionine synthase [Luteitalea pratensis]|uniref:Methionine adenosyltransferase n=1 Tax=Luteitalea pratensis TaxID=1855912 RepID=A0A143PRV5_LUTPR|nr:methionine adenosyltransferase [Luteitalea pratensis]AMY11345.1 S-adenosylmethionine synthase [Luteitalea pratensis]
MSCFVLTSESVSEGHPDKVADFISDSALDACLSQDPTSKVAVETLVKEDLVVLAGEVTTGAKDVDYEQIARQAIREIGYDWADEVFNADGVQVILKITAQSKEINSSVVDRAAEEQGAGDQGLMFGYASNESPELMPLPILLAHRLTRGLAEDRKKGGAYRWIRPDSKSQVSVRYENGTPVAIERVVVSTQHVAEAKQDDIKAYVIEELAPRVLGDWTPAKDLFLVNPSGSFSHGGPSADAGVTGRKIIVDSYGGAARHGGGAFSGKDPSKVDRSAAYFGRYVAREVVKARLAARCEVQFSYAIGVAEPTSLLVETFGTGDNKAAEVFVRKTFDMRPAGIIKTLNLLRPIYRQTTNYGHFGRPGLPWEA